MPSVKTDLLAPRYVIVIEGTKLKEDVTAYISSVEYEEEPNSSSKITLEVLNQDMRFLDERVFAEGNKVDLWMGYAGKPLHFMNRGIIVKPDPRFPRSGIPRMTITANDLSQTLMTTGAKDKGKVYSKTLDSDIVSKIFKEKGIAPFVFQTKGKVTRVRKKGKTRWEFLKELAKLHNFVVWVRYDPEQGTDLGYFGPPDVSDQPTKHKFVYGTGELDATLLEFDPKMSLPSQSTEVEVSYTDPKTRKVHRIKCEVKKKDAEKMRFTAATGKDKAKQKILNGPSVTLTCFGQREEVIADRVFSSPVEAKRFAAAWFDARQQDFLFGRGTIVGSPDVRLGHVHELKGLGLRLSGDWVLTRVSHRMGGSGLYETSFDGTKKALKSVVGAPENVSQVKAEEDEQ
jgi:phage protein D